MTILNNIIEQRRDMSPAIALLHSRNHYHHCQYRHPLRRSYGHLGLRYHSYSVIARMVYIEVAKKDRHFDRTTQLDRHQYVIGT